MGGVQSSSVADSTSALKPLPKEAVKKEVAVRTATIRNDNERVRLYIFHSQQNHLWMKYSYNTQQTNAKHFFVNERKMSKNIDIVSLGLGQNLEQMNLVDFNVRQTAFVTTQYPGREQPIDLTSFGG